MSKSYPAPIHFCWVCEEPLGGTAIRDEHYSEGRTIYFCSSEHKSLHAQLKNC